MSRRSRARRNMAVKYEGKEYATWATTPKSVRGRIGQEPKPGKYKFRTASGGGITFKQAKVIGTSIGNMAIYCPDTAGYATHQEALQAAGVTSAMASQVIDALKQAGVVRWHRGLPWTPESGAKAAQILTRIAGIKCSL